MSVTYTTSQILGRKDLIMPKSPEHVKLDAIDALAKVLALSMKQRDYWMGLMEFAYPESMMKDYREREPKE